MKSNTQSTINMDRLIPRELWIVTK